MRKPFSLAIVVLVSLSFSTGLFAGETKAKEKMISGKISKVDCDNSIITISDVRNLRRKTEKLPDVTLRFIEKTRLTGIEGCKEIKVGTDLSAAYVAGDKGNVATEIIFTTNFGMKMKATRNVKKAVPVKYEPKKSGKLNQSESEKNK